jgi:hypothetical protein
VVGPDHRFDRSDYPALYQTADAASRAGRQAHTRLVGAELLLLVLAAAFDAAQPVMPTTQLRMALVFSAF